MQARTQNGKLGVKVALKINLVLLVVLIGGTFFLVNKQGESLEAELFNKGRIQSIIGAKMIGRVLEEAIDNGVFPVQDAFDTNYRQIGTFDPPKYHTKYDFYLDKSILGIQDEFLQDTSVVYAVAVDRNGYLPTHNSRFQKSITNDPEKNRKGNRTKRIFDDPVGIKAAQNQERGFRQIYYRDTGEVMWDISSPIFVKNKHWGAFRVGLSLEAIGKARRELATSLIAIMAIVLVISIGLSFIVVHRSLVPLVNLAATAHNLAQGTSLENEIHITSNDEIGGLQAALNRLRLSMLIALQRKN